MWNFCKRWLFGNRARTGRGRHATARRRRSVLHVEALEDRLAPAAVLTNPAPAAATPNPAVFAPNTGASGATVTNVPTSSASQTTQPSQAAQPFFISTGSPGQFTGTNLAVPVLAQGTAASTLGIYSSQLSEFPFIDNTFVSNPDMATGLAQGGESVLSLTTQFVGVERFSLSTAIQFWETLNPTQILTGGLGHLGPVGVVPVGSRSLTTSTLPSSGSSAPSLLPVPEPGQVPPPSGLPPQGVPAPLNPNIPLRPNAGNNQGQTSGTNAASAISGAIFRDLNGNGVRDLDEPGLAGIKVVLEVEKGQAVALVATTSTDADGRYFFPNLPAGVYQVHPQAPAGYRLEKETRSVILRLSTKAAEQNFGLVPIKQKQTDARPPADSQAALVDRLFSGWDGASLVGNPLVDHVFADDALTAPPSGAAHSDEGGIGFGEASLFVGAAAAVAEFDLFPRSERSWEDDE
jgi:hypothetical protein